MNNTAKIAIISLVAIVIVAAVIFSLISKSGNQTDANNQPANNTNTQNSLLLEDTQPAPIEVLTPEEAGGVDIVEIVGDQELEEDFMTAAEKEKMGIDPSVRVQVLARDEFNNILGYTILAEGADPLVDIEQAIGSEVPSAAISE